MVLGFNRPYAHPTSSFNSPAPTPLNDPDVEPLVQVSFAYEWLPYVLGALQQLYLQTTWKGDPDDVLLAQDRAQTLATLFSEWQNYADLAPFWDDEDAEDAPGDPSEGEGFPWYENVSDFVVTAFLATSFTPDAAIAFVTTARKLRLAFRSRDYGAIVDVFIDDVLQAEVDTYSADPGIVYADIYHGVADPPGTSYDLRIVHTGTENPDAIPLHSFGMEVIRKRLWEGELEVGILGVRQNEENPCILEYTDDGTSWAGFADLLLCIPPPVGIRYGEECDCIESTYDGGVTWTPTPISDPRSSDVYRTIIPSSTKCDSAASMTRYVHDMVDQVLTMIDAATIATDATALLISLLVTLGPFGIFAIAILAFWTLCVGTGSVIINAAFDEALYDQLLCILFFNLEDDGTLTDAGLGGVYSDIDGQIASADVRAILHGMFGIMGCVGLSNAGGLALDTDDCSSCADEVCVEAYPNAGTWGEWMGPYPGYCPGGATHCMDFEPDGITCNEGTGSMVWFALWSLVPPEYGFPAPSASGWVVKINGATGGNTWQVYSGVDDSSATLVSTTPGEEITIPSDHDYISIYTSPCGGGGKVSSICMKPAPV